MQPTSAKKQSFYGLDADLLKSLNLEELIEDKEKEEKKKPQNSKEKDLMNMTFEDLRKAHGMDPNNQGVSV